MPEIWSGADSNYWIIAIITGASVVRAVNTVTALRAFHAIWNWAVCGARIWPKHLLFKETTFLWTVSISIRKLHYIGNGEGKAQEDSQAGETAALLRRWWYWQALGMPVHLLWVPKYKQDQKTVPSETVSGGFTEKADHHRAMALFYWEGQPVLMCLFSLASLILIKTKLFSSEFELNWRWTGSHLQYLWVLQKDTLFPFQWRSI